MRSFLIITGFVMVAMSLTPVAVMLNHSPELAWHGMACIALNVAGGALLWRNT